VPSSSIGSVFESVLGSVLEIVCELTWEHIVKQAGSVIECN